MVTKEMQLKWFLALENDNAKCKHCAKQMISSWWETTKGYCYICSVYLGFHILREKACTKIIDALNILYCIANLNFQMIK